MISENAAALLNATSDDALETLRKNLDAVHRPYRSILPFQTSPLRATADRAIYECHGRYVSKPAVIFYLDSRKRYAIESEGPTTFKISHQEFRQTSRDRDHLWRVSEMDSMSGPEIVEFYNEILSNHEKSHGLNQPQSRKIWNNVLRTIGITPVFFAAAIGTKDVHKIPATPDAAAEVTGLHLD